MMQALPRLVLAPCARGGRQHNGQINNVFSERLRQWTTGQHGVLVDDHLRSLTLALRKKRKCLPPGSDDFPEASRRSRRSPVKGRAPTSSTRSCLGTRCRAGVTLFASICGAPLRPNGILTDWEAEDFKVEEIEKALASFPQAGVPASQDY